MVAIHNMNGGWFFQFSRLVLRGFCSKHELTFTRKLTSNNQRVIPELSEFSEEQEKLVLDQINHKSQLELSNMKGIGNVRGKAIIDHRAKHGPLESLRDLANIRGFGKAFFRNVLQADCIIPVQQKRNKLATLLSVEQKETISDVVSIDIGLNNAAYVHIDRDKRVYDWKRISIPVPKPYNPVECKNAINGVVTSLPNADLYLIELQSHRASRMDPIMFPFVLHLRVVEAMLHCLLKDKLVLDMNPLVTAKYFGLPIGLRKKKAGVDLISFMIRKTENVQLMEEQPEAYFEKARKIEGSKETVSTILATGAMSEQYFNQKWYAQFPDHLLDYFFAQKKKDDLSDCLLQALAFLDLAF